MTCPTPAQGALDGCFRWEGDPAELCFPFYVCLGGWSPAPGSKTHCPSRPVSPSVTSRPPPVSPSDHSVHHEKGCAPGLRHCALTAGSLGPFLSLSLFFSLEAPIRPRLSPQSQLLPAPVTCTGSLDDTPALPSNSSKACPLSSVAKIRPRILQMHPPPVTRKGGCSAQLGNPHAGAGAITQSPSSLRGSSEWPGNLSPSAVTPFPSWPVGSVFSLHHFLSTCHVILTG